MARDDELRHQGRHHYAPCGEYRPIAGNRECKTCPEICPACGSRYHYREA